MRTPARWLAWATAGLLATGVVSVGVVSDRNDRADQRIVAAAGNVEGGVEVPTTLAPPVLPPPTTTPPTTAPAPTTTAPKPTTTTPPTTQPPRTTTTRPPVTSTTVVAGVTLTVVNQYAYAVVLTVNGRTFQLAPGQTEGPVPIDRYSHGNDIVEIKVVEDPTCGSGDADGYFPNPGSYRMTVVAGPSVCQGGRAGPDVKVTPA